jgi:hypothetical protein
MNRRALSPLHRQAAFVAPGANAIARYQGQACECLLQAYVPYGGAFSGDDLVAVLADATEQPISRVAHWIVEDRLIHLQVGGAICIPRFQFHGRQLRPLLHQAVGELRGFCDAFEIAQWFVTPNAWLRDRLPVALVLQGDTEVVEAARADRYLCSGN